MVSCGSQSNLLFLRTKKVASQLLDMGCYEVSLGDTIGKGTPKTIEELLKVLCSEINQKKLAGHFHDTSDTAIRNVEIGLKYGLSTFDSAVGGLGGCPYAPGAKGNLNTRSLIEAFGINSFNEDLDLDKIKFAEKYIGKINQN